MLLRRIVFSIAVLIATRLSEFLEIMYIFESLLGGIFPTMCVRMTPCFGQRHFMTLDWTIRSLLECVAFRNSTRP